jgi:O-antigen/teichoic acid export membrane protein
MLRWVHRVGANITKPGLLGSIAVLMSWTAAAQMISAVAMLVLPRIFAPADFGAFSVFSGFVILLAIVAAGRYEFAIGLPQDDRDGSAVFWLCVLLSSMTSIACASILLLLPVDSYPFRRFPGLLAWWPWVAAGGASVAWYTAAAYLALRSGQFKALGLSKAAIALSTVVGQIFAGLAIGRSSQSLIVPFVFGQAVGVAYLGLALGRGRIARPDRVLISMVAKRFRHFPQHVAPGSVMEGLSSLLPVTFVAVALSVTDAGIYAMADRALRMPVTLVGSSILQVFYKRIAELRGDRIACRNLLGSTWRNLAYLAILPCILIVFFGQEVFALVLGETWRPSGLIAQSLIVWMFFQFVSYPTSNVFVVNDRTGSFLVWQAVQLAAVVAALGGAHFWAAGSLQVMVSAMVLGQTLVCLFSMWLQWRVLASAPENEGIER